MVNCFYKWVPDITSCEDQQLSKMTKNRRNIFMRQSCKRTLPKRTSLHWCRDYYRFQNTASVQLNPPPPDSIFQIPRNHKSNFDACKSAGAGATLTQHTPLYVGYLNDYFVSRKIAINSLMKQIFASREDAGNCVRKQWGCQVPWTGVTGATNHIILDWLTELLHALWSVSVLSPGQCIDQGSRHSSACCKNRPLAWFQGGGGSDPLPLNACMVASGNPGARFTNC
jgi:hypothetical protein